MLLMILHIAHGHRTELEGRWSFHLCILLIIFAELNAQLIKAPLSRAFRGKENAMECLPIRSEK